MNSDKPLKIALLGNPNAGKTSLLNSLAGLHLHVGNWPGKTVEKKQASIKFNDKFLNIIDLPGIYSLSPYSEEEKISKQFIIEEKPDVIVQIIDVNALEKSLFLFFEILGLGSKVVLAFNFNKEADKKGLKINIEKIQKKLSVPIVKIEANIGKNNDELLETILKTAQENFEPPIYLDDLLNLDKNIKHVQSLSFIEKDIKPFYLNKKLDKRLKDIDYWVLNKFSAFPIFLVSIFLLFKITFVLANPLIAGINYLLVCLSNLISTFDLVPWLVSFLNQGILDGLGSVLAFIPLIFILFFLIAIFEDSGYLARIVVLLDRPFAWLGISGQSFIPMILGFGCNVPAIMATRTIRNRRERMIAIFVNPFISCSARLGIYALFAKVFFPNKSVLVIMFLYLLGIIIALGASLILSKFLPSKENEVFIMEIPPYRYPNIKNIFKTSWWRTKLFIKKAGTIIFSAIILVWFLAFFPAEAEYASKSSYLGIIGQALMPIFKPLGFGTWFFSVSLLFGFLAKETIIGTLGALLGGSGVGLMTVLPNIISPLNALTFLVFVSLYVPCLATISAIKSERKSWFFVLMQVFVVMSVAWIISALVYYFGYFLF